jgi:hypothetical protein
MVEVEVEVEVEREERRGGREGREGKGRVEGKKWKSKGKERRLSG